MTSRMPAANVCQGLPSRSICCHLGGFLSFFSWRLLCRSRMRLPSPFASATAATISSPANTSWTTGLTVCLVVCSAPVSLSAKTITSPEATPVIIAPSQ